MRTFVLARHGESVFSVSGLLNGDPSVPGGLTAEGVEEARRLGAELAADPIDLCVTTELERTKATADVALEGRGVPRTVMPAFNDPRYGPFESGALEDYRAWAARMPSSAAPGGGGESRYAIVRRYARGYVDLLARPERGILLVAHSLPISYALGARVGGAPAARVPLAAYATPYRFSEAELENVVAVLERWLAAPTF